MHRNFRSLTALACLVTASSASAQVFVDDFEGGVNQGGWSFGNGFDTLEVSGGNPDGYLHNMNIDTFAPMLRTTTSSVFTGDWRARDVASFGVDLRTLSTNFPFMREATLILSSGPGCSVYFLGTDFVPQPIEGWKSFDFSIDSQSTTLPPGWVLQNPCGSVDDTWNTIITNVTEVRIFYGDPTFFFIFDQWNVGTDNARIAETDLTGNYCTSNVNSSGGAAMMSASGSASVGADDAVLTAAPLPVGVNGIFYYGGETNMVPFGEGIRCVSGGMTGIFRLPIENAGPGGVLTHDLDIANPPNAGGQITPGSTWYFQAWFRDQSGGPSGFNLSDGYEITFDL